MIRHDTEPALVVCLSLSLPASVWVHYTGTWGGSNVTTSSLCVQFTKLYRRVTSLHLGAPSYLVWPQVTVITGIIMDRVRGIVSQLARVIFIEMF